MPRPSWLLRLFPWLHRQRAERELDDEVRLHLELETRRHLDAGMPPADAARAARVKLGNIPLIRERTRAVWSSRWLEDLRRDVRIAVRMLRRGPTYTITTVLTLAVGIGATTAVFSLVDGVLLSPLPYRDPERLMILQVTIPEIAELSAAPVNPRSILAWQAACHETCDGLAAIGRASATLTGIGEPEGLLGAAVSPNLFEILGVNPVFGRTFRAGDDEPGRQDVVVITHGFWRRRFGADPGTVGRTITLDGRPTEVIGVLAESFHFPRMEHLWSIDFVSGAPEFFRPLVFTDRERRSPGTFEYVGVLRLREDTSPEQAQAELEPISEAAFRDVDIHPRPVVRPLADQLVGRTRQALWLLLAAVLAAFVVACANVTSLLAARWLGRHQELAVRRALGAETIHLVRQTVSEGMLLSLLGGVGGLFIARVSVRALVASTPLDVPRLQEVTVDLSVLGFATLLTLACGVCIGLVPAWQAGRADPADALKASARVMDERRTPWRSALAGIEVALATALLIVSGWLLASFVRVLQVDRGFDVDRTLAVDLKLPPARYSDGAARIRFHDALLDRLRTVAGIEGVGLTQRLPLEGVAAVDDLFPLDDRLATEGHRPTNYLLVNPDYFRTMGIVLTRGRSFADTDRARRVAVVSEYTARTTWPGRDPIGQRFHQNDPAEAYEVVGVVADARILALERQAGLVAYLPYWELGFAEISLIVPTRAESARALAAVRDAVQTIDPQLPLQNVRTMTGVLAEAVAVRRFQMMLTAGFALAALLLVCLGVYGVVAAAAARRQRELALRLALGGTVVTVMRLVVLQGLRPVAAGAIAGIAVALATGRAMAALLFDVQPYDPAIIGSVMLVVGVVSCLACLVPARRAARIDPMTMLRSE